MLGSASMRTIAEALHRLQGSGSLPSFVGVNALVILRADKAELDAGEKVEAILLGPGLRVPARFSTP